MIINASNLFKLFVRNVPKCENCIYFQEINQNGNCKMFGDIIYARSLDKNCSVIGKYFIPIITNKKKYLLK